LILKYQITNQTKPLNFEKKLIQNYCVESIIVFGLI